jgi:signal peptidase
MEYAKRSLGGLFGTRAFLGMQGTATIVFVLSVLAYLVDLALGSDRTGGNRHERTRKKGMSGTVIVLSCTAIIVLAATSSMLLTAGGQVYAIDSVENTDNGGLEAGTSERTNYTYINRGFVPMVVVYETDQPDISVTRDSQFVGPRSSRNATVIVTAPEEPGRYERRVSQRQYIGVLPRGMIEALYGVHPVVPVIVIDAVVGGVFFLIGYWIVGTGTIKSRSRDKPGKLRTLLSRFM